MVIARNELLLLTQLFNSILVRGLWYIIGEKGQNSSSGKWIPANESILDAPFQQLNTRQASPGIDFPIFMCVDLTCISTLDAGQNSHNCEGQEDMACQ